MKAVTLRQPFASLVALGEMWIETRDWQTAYRGSLAIHAAKAFTREDAIFTVTQPEVAGALVRHGLKGSGELPLGAVVAIAQLVDVVAMDQIDRAWVTQPNILGPSRYAISEKDQAFGDFSAGRYAWILADVERLPKSVPAADGEGLWDWEDDRQQP
jgi:hypothetical protein